MKAEKEKNIIYEWASVNERLYHDVVFTKKDISVETYFKKRQETSGCLKKYEFSTLPEFREMLENMWENEPAFQEIVLPLSVAAFKEMPRFQEKVEEHHDKEELKSEDYLPEYIYNF